MILNNIVSGVFGFLIGIFIVIAFGPVFDTIVGGLDTGAQFFLAGIVIFTLASILFFNPIELITADDEGNIN